MDLVLNTDYIEDDFLAACTRGERWAQQKLYVDNYGKLMGICLRYSSDQDEAVDILHDAFLKIFRNIGQYKPGTSLYAWLRTVVVNTAIDHYRYSVRKKTEDLDLVYAQQADNLSPVENLTVAEILAAVQNLSPAYRLVFNMYVIEGFSHREIADTLEITESTSRANLVKARAKLKEVLIRMYEKG